MDKELISSISNEYEKKTRKKVTNLSLDFLVTLFVIYREEPYLFQS